MTWLGPRHEKVRPMILRRGEFGPQWFGPLSYDVANDTTRRSQDDVYINSEGVADFQLEVPFLSSQGRVEAAELRNLCSSGLPCRLPQPKTWFSR